MKQTAAYFREYKLKNKDRIRAANKLYYIKNKDKILAGNKAWWKKNPEKVKRLKDQWRLKRPDLVKLQLERQRIYRINNPEKIREQAFRLRPQRRQHYIKNRVRILKQARISNYKRYANNESVRRKISIQAKLWHKNNPEKVRDKSRRWKLKNPEKVYRYSSISTQKRRAAKRGNTVNPLSIIKFAKSIREKDFVSCYYCNEKTSGRTAHFDHIVPLSKGGAHSVSNLCASCPRCNMKKHNKLIHEWFRLGQQILSL